MTVSPSLAIALINAQCPSLAPVLLEPFGAGWDNAAYLVNGEWVFRFPRRAIAVDLLEAEVHVLPRLAPRSCTATSIPGMCSWTSRAPSAA